MTIVAAWLVGAAFTYWLAERELDPGQTNRSARREIAVISIVAWPGALAIYLLSLLGVIGDGKESE